MYVYTWYNTHSVGLTGAGSLIDFAGVRGVSLIPFSIAQCDEERFLWLLF